MGLLLSLKRDRLWMPKKTRKTGRKLPLFLMLKSEKFSLSDTLTSIYSRKKKLGGDRIAFGMGVVPLAVPGSSSCLLTRVQERS